MHKQHTINSLILFITIFACVHSFEIFIKKTNNKNDSKIEEFKSFHNKTYNMSLLQTRYITIQVTPNDLYHDHHTNKSNVIGFKFQVKSTNIRVLDVKKEVIVPSKLENTTKSNNILLEDLFICKTNCFIEFQFLVL
ncbi:unnamed protein product [Rotaria magnacalcarata]|uniref:Uncharacterized protein n=1 Tax=Rotaria magnacalcarata TaxID=392030 RepID=A0A819HZ89_9BILA|nr:unnamed protein product [Rotaria magnacalcarata]